MGKGKFFKKGKTADGVAKINSNEATGDAAKNVVENKKAENKKPEGSRSKAAETSGKANFTGLIFMCNSSTKQDCFKYRVFGLPEGKKDVVEQVKKGMRLFLFDVGVKRLYGVYKASSRGGFKLEPEAFRGSFPWQVRFDIFQECIPLEESAFRNAIKENYNNKGKFKIELSLEQVQKLVKLFRPLPKETAASGDLPQRMVPLHHVEAPPKIDYKPKFPSQSNYEPSFAAEDLHRAREARLQQETRHLDLINTNSGVTGYIPPSSLPAYGTDPILPELQLRNADPYQSRAGYDLYSAYPQGHTLGNLAGEVDALYRQRQAPHAHGELLLDRRVYGLDPLVESSSSYTGLGNHGLLLPPSRPYLQEQPLPRNEFGVRLPYEGTSVIPGAFTGLAAQARHYVGGGW